MPKPDFRTFFLAGLRHFNALEFWEAHEAWETLWLVAESDVEQYLQGLIQVAAAYHHVRRGTYRGAVRLFEAGQRRLAPFPIDFCGAGRAEVEAAVPRHRQWAAAALEQSGAAQRLPESEYPKLQEGEITPPSDDW